MSEENAQQIRAAIWAAVHQTMIDGGDFEHAVKIARANIDALDRKQDKITYDYAPGALRRAVGQAWESRGSAF